MSDEPIRADVPDEAAEAVSFDRGVLLVDLAGLPPGSLVTITVRVGPEAPAPQAEPPAQAKRHLGQRINTP